MGCGGSKGIQSPGGKLAFPEIKSKHSLVYKYVTKELWDKYSGHKTQTTGYYN